MPTRGRPGKRRAEVPRRPVRVRPAPEPPVRPVLRPGPRALLSERPHAHIVCRSCGRIASLGLDTEAELRLEAIAGASPEGWSVDLIAFSLTGACPKCRQGPAAPE